MRPLWPGGRGQREAVDTCWLRNAALCLRRRGGCRPSRLDVRGATIPAARAHTSHAARAGAGQSRGPLGSRPSGVAGVWFAAQSCATSRDDFAAERGNAAQIFLRYVGIFLITS
jgi:hypothetical protein